MAKDISQVSTNENSIPLLEPAIKTIFSWIVLMPIAVIVSGHLLSQIFRLQRPDQQQYFRIPIPRFIEIRADGDSVILGFTGFFITLLILSTLSGKAIYGIFKEQFGIDPGQFNALCVFSALSTVLWSAILYLILRSRIRNAEALAVEHSSLIEKASSKKAVTNGIQKEEKN
jgi:hypothetical protein